MKKRKPAKTTPPVPSPSIVPGKKRAKTPAKAPAAKGPEAAAEAPRHFDDRFLANVSHELRTPLSAMMLWSTMLLNRTDVSPAVRGGLEAIKQGADEQHALIGAIADFSRIQAGRLRIQPRPTDLTLVVRSAVDAIRPAANEKKIELSGSYDSDIGVVMADAQRIQQIAGTLLNNAVKFSDPGGRVRLDLRRENASVTVQVTDTGVGIGAAELPSVLRRFADGAGLPAKRPRGGLGLNLAIARHLAELHGGTLSVESGGSGRGAAFTLTLPLKPIPSKASAQRPAV